MNILLLGVNGIGMQGLAFSLIQAGNRVFGYDAGSPLGQLIEVGLQYVSSFPDSVDLVVFSGAFKENHPWLLEAKKKNIKSEHRASFLANLKKPEEIIITGAHGKTTTTGMLAYINEKKSYFLGGILNGSRFPANNDLSAKYSVIEADESDASFLFFKSKYRVLLNIDFEHMDFYKNKENLLKANEGFVANTPENGFIVLNKSCPYSIDFAIKHQVSYVSFGMKGQGADFEVEVLQTLYDGLNIRIYEKIKGEAAFKDFYVSAIGDHNALNFCAIYALSFKLNLDFVRIKDFPGIKKRMQKLSGYDNFFIDYGHHPDEINAVLNSIKAHKNIRLKVAFEAHKYSRLAFNWQRWADVFKGHEVFVLPVHAAGESVMPGFSEVDFVKFLESQGIKASFQANLDFVDKNNLIIFSAGVIGESFSSK